LKILPYVCLRSKVFGNGNVIPLIAVVSKRMALPRDKVRREADRPATSARAASCVQSFAHTLFVFCSQLYYSYRTRSERAAEIDSAEMAFTE
jgi:hypothetical protein